MKFSVFSPANLLVCTGALAVLTACGGGDKQAQQAAMMAQQAPAIEVMTLSTGNSENQTVYPATLRGKTDIDIRPQVTGFITKVHVDEGQHVSKGQVLFTLDQVQFRAAVDQAQAAVNAAQTQVNNAKLTAETNHRLFEKNIISQYDVQTADNALRTAQASLAQAQAALVNAKKNLAYTVVTAPSSGVVGSIPNREGSLASPSSAQPLTTVSDNSSVYAYFSLTEKDILDMTDNGNRSLQKAIAAMPSVKLQLADGNLYGPEGKVATASGVIDQTTGAVSVRALFPNPSGMLQSGASGNVIIPRNQQDVIVIPQKATYELQDRKFVYVLADSNKVVSTPVEVVANVDGTTYVVTSGLTPGQKIAVEGVGTKLQDGMKIQPVEGGAKKQAPAQAAQAPAKK